MVATLTRIFGLEHLSLAEDVVQEALARAMQTWPFRGVPDNPAAWIMRTSRNLALDHVRRERNFRDKEPELVRIMGDDAAASADPASTTGQEIADDRLRMLFVCCHPQIPVESQIALALKVLGGFSPAEIATAFLTTEAAIAKRLTRARQQLRDAGITFSIPEGAELDRRMDVVLHSLYLLFNEGYKASSGDQLVRADVCHEAIRLTELLVRHPAGNQPAAHALLALMFFNVARLASRTDDEGGLLRLQDQDRSTWDRALIARGMFHLLQSAQGNHLDTYHLQAAIAAEHCRSPSYAATNWEQILRWYDRLLQLAASPVVALNRCVVIANIRGPEAGLEALEQVGNLRSLETYHLLHAVRGEFELTRGNTVMAAAHFERALALAGLSSEQDFLRKRLASCNRPATAK